MKDRSLTLLTIAFVMFACVGLAAVYVLGANGVKAFDARNDTQTVEVKKGETFKLVLDENPTTGYAWVINMTSGLVLAGDTFVPPDSGLAGAGGQHEWQIKATGTGDQQITGTCKRSWEPTIGNESSYTLRIKIV